MIDNINDAVQRGAIIKYQPNDEVKIKIKDAIKKETKTFLLTTLGISIASIVILIILVALHNFILEKLGFVIIKYALFVIPGIGVLSPLYGIYDFFSKNKSVKNNNYECFVARIENNIDNSDYYKLLGVNNEKAEYLKMVKPFNKVNVNDKVLLIRINGDNYLADINQLNDSSLLLINN